MCGVAGLLGKSPTDEKIDSVQKMIAMQRHRGPDGQGIYVDSWVGLGHARLSIVDLEHGAQPMQTSDGRYTIVFNGEIFNHKDLRKDLEAQGSAFATQCDTEVFLQLFAKYGASAVEKLNGEWACAIWDRDDKRLFLSRDPNGVRPLHYVCKGGAFAFASEVKSLFTLPWVERAFDPETLDDILHFWAPLPGRSAFKGVNELPAGHSMFVSTAAQLDIFSYSDFSFSAEKTWFNTEEDALELLHETLQDAVRIRLDADVPVGAYLSGGLDSSLVTALASRLAGEQITTFGLSFADPSYDEGFFQKRLAHGLGVKHHTIFCDARDLGSAFHSAVKHAERPLVRTAPAPMYLLSRAVRDRGYKVVLTGEGADEFFGGYDIFRETLARHYLSKRSSDQAGAMLYAKLYTYMPDMAKIPSRFIQEFFGKKSPSQLLPLYSHLPRIELTRRVRALLHPDLRMKEYASCERLIKSLPYSFHTSSDLDKSQYLEAKVLMPGYILSSQGDRMSMAHSVEGRFPFLDPRVIRFASRLPSHLRVLGLKEKWLLKRLGKKLLPPEIWQRPKQPFRAPDSDVLRSGVLSSGGNLLDFISPERVKAAGLFCPKAAENLRQKFLLGEGTFSVRDQMAMSFALSSQILHEEFSLS